VGQAINDRGQVAFVADLKSGGEAIYRTEGDGRLTTIAQTDGLIRDFYLSPYMNDRGRVSFGADLTDGRQALFTGSGGDLTRIADTEPASPFSGLPPPAPRIGSDGAVTFQAPLKSGGKGFFVGNGGLLSTLYVTGGQFSAFPGSPASQVHGDLVAFRATLTGGPDGVFRGNGLQTDTIVTAGDTYSSFVGSEINDEGTVGIIANLTAGGQAIVIAKDGTLTTFVDTSGPFSHISEGRLSISNQEGAVFGANLAAGGVGIFDGPDSVADKILATRDKLFSSTVVGFPANYLNPRGLNNAGQVIFRATLADGRTVLVRADRDGEEPDGLSGHGHDHDGGHQGADPDGEGQDGLPERGHDNAGGPQSENAFLALSLPTASLISLPPSADSMSSILASPPSPLQSDGWGLFAGGFVPTPAAMAPADVERLDQFFAAGMDDGTSFTLPQSRGDPLSLADELGVDVVSWA
jgi:hypothetical protein